MKDSAISAKQQQRYLQRTLNSIAKNDPCTKEVVLEGFIIGDKQLSALAMSLINNTHIRILYLRNTGISEKGANLLAFALKKNTTLEHLWLNGNHIGSAGAGTIAAALVGNKTLITLGLSDNLIGNSGGKKLVNALRQNQSITDIFLDGNDMSQKIVDKIDSYCDRNRGCETEDEDDTEKSGDLDESTCAYSDTPSHIKSILESIEAGDVDDYYERWLDNPECLDFLYKHNIILPRNKQEESKPKFRPLRWIRPAKRIRPSHQ